MQSVNQVVALAQSGIGQPWLSDIKLCEKKIYLPHPPQSSYLKKKHLVGNELSFWNDDLKSIKSHYSGKLSQKILNLDLEI